jgi:putative ABC transport system ATP-binding protein
MADRVIRINDAKVREETLNPDPKTVQEIEW